MGANFMSGNMPTFFGNLPKLRSIIISYNQNIRGTIPSDIGNLSNLEVLRTQYTSMTGTMPNEICALPKISIITMTSDNTQNNNNDRTKCDCCTNGNNYRH